MNADKKITLLGLSVEQRKIPISEAVYRQAIVDERLDHELDAYLSDMDGVTVVIEPDGTVVSPYGDRVDLMEILAPVLDLIPAESFDRYVSDRWAPDE